MLRFCERFGVLGPNKEISDFDEMAISEIEDGLPDWSLGARLRNKFGVIAADQIPATQAMSLLRFKDAHEEFTNAMRAAQMTETEGGYSAERARENLCRIIAVRQV